MALSGVNWAADGVKNTGVGLDSDRPPTGGRLDFGWSINDQGASRNPGVIQIRENSAGMFVVPTDPVYGTEILSLQLAGVSGGLPQSNGGRSMDGIAGPTDGGLTDVPTEIDPPLIVPVTVNVANFGPSTLSGAVFQVRVFKEPGNRSVLLVVDESDGANVWFEEALTDIGVAYDIVFVDTQYTPVYQDADPLTKDLKDYEIVLWETSNDRSGTLANPAQPELRKYLADQGCLFLGGDGFMAEWPARSGTLMADWMFADGYGGDTFDLAVDGVRGTIGDGLSLVLAGGTGSSLQTFGTSLAGVKPPGKAAFLYNKSLAAIQGENETANGTYKTVLFSFSFDSISDRPLRDETMRRVIDYLTCKPSGGGDTPVPDIPTTWVPGVPTVTITTNVTLPPGNYVATLTLRGADTFSPNNVATTKIRVKPVVTDITSCGTIDEPGAYRVTQDIQSPGDCLVIKADGVTIDGMGHQVFFGFGGAGTGISVIDADGSGIRDVFVAGLRVNSVGGATTGVYVRNATANVQLRGLQVSQTEFAFWLVDAAGVRIGEANVMGNNVGAIVQWTIPPPPLAQATLVANNIFQNPQNAIDPIGFATWNVPLDCSRPNIVGGPCMGGNFWSDYTGVDLNADFIGDTNLPYNSNGNIQVGGDFLPLIQP